MNASEFNTVSTKQLRIAQLAKQSPDMVFTSLAYHMDMDWLSQAYGRTRKDGASGVDEVTAKEYEANLDENLKVQSARWGLWGFWAGNRPSLSGSEESDIARIEAGI